MNPKQDEPDKPTQENKDTAEGEKIDAKPPTVRRPVTGSKTGALKLPLNWDSLPDNKLGRRNFLPSTSPRPDTTDETKKTRSEEEEKQFFSFNNSKTAEEEPEKNPDTAVLSHKSPSWKKIIDGQSQGTTSTLGEEREVLFVIRGMIERVVMKDNGVVTMGRFDTGTVPNEEIDLIPYGALDRGVSRRHCKIQLREDNLYVTDLHSTNGTFLAGVRLNPNESTVLRKGDELLLGRLAVQILFR